jgi:hypothetical protein
MRSMVEGHASYFLPYLRSATLLVPLHHLRWSPSPFRGGSATDGRLPAFVLLPAGSAKSQTSRNARFPPASG